jgi:hypothetical protein
MVDEWFDAAGGMVRNNGGTGSVNNLQVLHSPRNQRKLDRQRMGIKGIFEDYLQYFEGNFMGNQCWWRGHHKVISWTLNFEHRWLFEPVDEIQR